MLLPGRDTFDPQYRYGFNGKEKEFDFRGFGQISDYGARIYNARLGKFLSVDPLQKSFPWYTPYQFAGNKPIMAIDVDGLEEWVAIFTNGSNKPAAFRYAPELKPLGAGQIYKRTFDLATGATSLSVYSVNKNATVNLAFIPDEKLIKEDQNHQTLDALSAYYQDARFFKGLDSKSDNFAAIGVNSLEEMAFKGVSYAMENNTSIKDVIIDFHGTQHGNNDVRFDGQPHKLSVGSESLEVDSKGSPSNYNDKKTHLFQLLGKFTTDDSQTLMGACNADKVVQVLKLISRDLKSTVYGHKSYSYSTDLDEGRFYSGRLSYIFHDGNRKDWGKYLKVLPNGKVTPMGGVKFSVQPKTAGNISPESQP